MDKYSFDGDLIVGCNGQENAANNSASEDLVTSVEDAVTTLGSCDG